MNIPTITMDPELAKAKLKEYRASVHTLADAEYLAAAKAYAALGRGRKLLNLREVFRDAPVDDRGRPRLGIARADRRQEVQLSWGQGRTTIFFSTMHNRADDYSYRAWSAANRGRNGLTLGVNIGRAPLALAQYATLEGWAMVPMVPAAQKGNRNLLNHLVLWEVEHWAETSQRPRPDKDPLLLRHLAGDLYVVVAAWDLTEVERAIMGERSH